jgi:hypothetical protein
VPPMIRPSVVLAVSLAVVVVLAGCGADGSREPAPAAPVPAQTLPSPAPSSTTTLVGAPPRMVRVVDGFSVFEVNAQQHELIGRRLVQVLHREGLWDQGSASGPTPTRTRASTSS